MQGATQTALEPRISNGLDQFVAGLRDVADARILDLSGANQWNLDFLATRGRLTSDEFTHATNSAFGSGGGDFFENQSDPQRVEQFCRLSLDYDPATFDGVLVWDSLEYLAPQLLDDVVAHLFDITKPGALLLCYFHANPAATKLPVTKFRILDSRTIQTAIRQENRPAQFYSNRAVERVFQSFQSVKFFLTRDSLREVIVRR